MQPPIGTTNQLNLLSNPLGFMPSETAPNVLGFPIQNPSSGAAPAAAGGGGGTRAAAPAAPSAAQIALDTQLSRLPGQLGSADQNVLNAYQSAYNQLTNQKNANDTNYNETKGRTQQDYQTSVGGIRQGIGQGLTGIQRLLGSRGAGNSSAASILAPYAAGQVGQQQLGGVNTTFNRNITSLDNAYGDANNQFSNSFGDLAAQRDAKLQQDKIQSDTTRANLLAQSANPDINQINALQREIDSLGVTPNFTPPVVTPKAVNLADYNYINPGAPQIAGSANPAVAQQTGAFYNLLGLKDKLAGATA